MSKNQILFATVIVSALHGLPLAAQLSAEKALEALKPADGLEVSLFAAEPDVVNPTCMDIDPEGRVWVCEGVNYRGKARPPHRKTGDRIVVLEDRDGDGRADHSRTFHEGLDLEAPLGICWLPGRLYVSQSPRIFSIEIRPDGTAGEVKDFLVGFHGSNHDHGVHSLVLGPDGLFYGAFGNEGAAVTDRSGRRISSSGKPWLGGMVFRCDLQGRGLEVLAHNFRNNYECALDSFGTIFQSDNDDDGNQWVRFVYVMEGGNYGYLGPTGRHWSEEKKSHWHMEDPGVVPVLLRTGAGSPTGLCVYEGDLLPPDYQGMPIHADAGPRVVQCFRVRPEGAGYRVQESPLDEQGRQTIDTLSRIVHPHVLLTSSDTWFRPSDVAPAPDGSLLVADWYDPGVGGHGMGDTTRGRIWRLTPAGHRGYRSPPLDLSGEEGLLEALSSPALSRRSLAVLRLREQGERALPLLKRAAGSTKPAVRARALWLLGALEPGRSLVREALGDPDPRFRVLALRCLKQVAPGDFTVLIQPLLADSEAQVRREILLLLRDVPGEQALQAIAALAAHYDGHDRFYLEALGIACRGREAEAFRVLEKSWPEGWSRRRGRILWELHPAEAGPYLEKLLLAPSTAESDRREIVSTLAELEGEAGGLALARVLSSPAPLALKLEAAGLIGERLPGRWKFLRGREELRAGAEALLEKPESLVHGLNLIAPGRLHALDARLESFAADGAAAAGIRTAAVRGLSELDDRKWVPLLQGVARSAAAPVGIEAVSALSRMSGSEAAESLKQLLLETGSVEVRSQLVKSLGASKSGALLLLRMAEENELPDAARSLAATVVNASVYEDVRLLAGKLLPLPRAAGGKDLPPAAELLAGRGDAERGRKVFFDENRGNCSRCHRLRKKGGEVGPDLSAIGVKLGREALLEALLSPSAAISHEFRVWILKTRSSGFASGILAGETEAEVTLRDANGKKTSFKKSDILERKPSDISLMPEGLVGSMTAADLIDLVDFLSAQRADEN